MVLLRTAILLLVSSALAWAPPSKCVVELPTRTIKVALAIAKAEGWFARWTLSRRFNNPGCIRFVGQKNASLGTGGYAVYDDEDSGWRDLVGWIQRHSSLDSFNGKEYADKIESDVRKMKLVWRFE